MSKLMKASTGFVLAILVVFQYHFLMSFSGATDPLNVAGSVRTISFNPAYEDLTNPIALINEGLQTQNHLPKNIFEFGDHLVFSFSQILFQFDDGINNVFLNAQAVVIRFGIREALFPSHYFW